MVAQSVNELRSRHDPRLDTEPSTLTVRDPPGGPRSVRPLRTVRPTESETSDWRRPRVYDSAAAVLWPFSCGGGHRSRRAWLTL